MNHPRRAAFSEVTLDNLFLWCDAAVATHQPYPSRSNRRLIVPIANKVANVCTAFFFPPPSRLAFRARHLFEKDIRPDCMVSPALLDLLAPVAEGISIAALIGTPGPFRKLTCLILNAEGNPDLIAKIGGGPIVEGLLQNEANWISRLSSEPKTAVHVPSFVALLKNERYVALVQTILSGAPPPRYLTSVHADFIKAFHAGATVGHFVESPMHEAIYTSHSVTKSRLAAQWKVRWEQAIRRLTASGDFRHQLLAPAHRDFTRWNMREKDGKLHVYDWEFASQGYVPLYDLLHYNLLPSALRGRRISYGSVLRSLDKFVLRNGLPPDYMKGAATQTLAYLLDVSLFYMASHEERVANDKVVNAYGHLIDEILRG